MMTFWEITGPIFKIIEKSMGVQGSFCDRTCSDLRCYLSIIICNIS